MQAIRTKYFGPTNTRGSYIQAKCEAKTIRVPYDHALELDGNHRAACEALLVQMKWTNYTPMVGGYFGGDRYWVFLHEAAHSNITGAQS